ncbi:alpha/beta hydrolase family protein [Brevundimonas subvibrioides]|uniref:Putative lipoprotein n=1 Tax=Brevundimonas subvibrioides (strain ATCC 15264 / DSM 4735 / LMG 14903 / NBRC 16000 / CB 81) TaxID=633149 RepID=D9QHP9_BRESC|nr:alpha/beta hydrolase [Brevundimonas subvibrioides]ADK99324.1 putative lipoprotein [Brevundimonas subvibrioides ATCC 15264]
MIVAMEMVQAEAAQTDLAGRWEGALTVGGTALPIVIRVEPGPGGLVTVMDSPAQNVRGLPVAGLTRSGGTVRFTVPAARGGFEGAVSADGGTWTGVWTQGAGSLPLILTRAAATAEPAGPNRPQTPRPPFPYAAEAVTFRNDGAGIALAGTLTLPEGTGPFPAVVLLTGSGAQDRDETILDHKPFAVWADALTRRGIAVLRYDDRGVGGSGGGGPNETTGDFATDAQAAIAFLRTRPEIDPARIGLMGHSEGGATAPLAVRNGAPAAFVVLLAGPAMPGAEIIIEQAVRIATASGQTPAQVVELRQLQSRIMAAVLANKDDGPAAAAAAQAVLVEAGIPTEQARGSTAAIASGWYRSFVAYDPGPALSALTVPLLAVYGEKDLQVPADLDAGALRRLQPAAEIVILPGLNHLMQTATTGLPGEYGTIEETVSPAALATVTDWVVKVTAP